MTPEWGFLEPWLAVLRAGLVQSNTNTHERDLKVLLFYAASRDGLACEILSRITVRQDASQLRQLIEALELFTLLSFVNNKAFVDLVMVHTKMPTAVVEGHLYCPRWSIELVGIFTPNPAGRHSRVTWASLIGFPLEYSQEFQAAAQKLVVMKPKVVVEVSFRASIHWSCTAYGSEVRCRQKSGKCAGGINVVLTGFQKLLGLHVPAVVQLLLSCEKTTLLSAWQQVPVPKSPTCEYVSASIRNLRASSGFLELAGALARMPISQVCIDLDCGDWVEGPSQGVINALSTLICGRSFCTLSTLDRGNSKASPRAVYQWMDLSCSSVSDDVVVTAFSAVAEMCSKTQLTGINIHSMNPTRWAWLIYGLCSRTSDVRNPDNAVVELTIQEITLTKADMSAVAAVLETGFPLSTSRETRGQELVYGFVDMDEGAQLWPSISLADNNNGMVGSCKFRCRASYNATEGGLVDIVVPGYGICTTEIGDSVCFTADSKKPFLNKNRLCDRLKFYFDSIQDVELVLELLKLLFRNIRSLSIHVYNATQHQPILDLSVVATACPLLEKLWTNNCNITASCHGEELQTWPIRDMTIQKTDQVSDLIICLQNPALRMARELVELWVSPRENQNFDEEERRGLDALDEEFLPVTKQKLSKLAKAAMISVVTRSCAAVESKALYHMDANILSLIFVFASTPAQRTVWRFNDW